MDVKLIRNPDDLKRYAKWVTAHPHGNLWQSLEWKRYQEDLGREVRVYVLKGRGNSIVASALVVIDRTTFGLSTWDIPRGPLWAMGCERRAVGLLSQVIHHTKEEQCISLILSPPEELKAHSLKLKASSRHEHPEATRIIDLTQSNENILAQMKSKGRYNIRVAERNGVSVKESRDVDAFYELLTRTSKRDGFKRLPKSHYKAFLEELEGSFLLLAYQSPPPLHPAPLLTQRCGARPPPPAYAKATAGKQGGVAPLAIAGLMGVIWGGTGIYYYGASDYAYRANMAPYLLQWEGMRRCKAKGCRIYDLLGMVKSPPPSSPKEGEKCHPWTGVSKFKEQFGGRVVEYPSEIEIVLRPWLKKALTLKRKLIG